MRNTQLACPIVAMIASLLWCPLLAIAQQPGGNTPASPAARTQANAQARPDIEQKRAQAEQEARKSLDADAIAAIEETEKAVKAIAAGNTGEAMAAIERATGKINVLVARNPSSALIPVDAEVEVIDAAPLDLNAIRERAKSARRAVEDKDYPAARVLLRGLTSEIRIRTYHLPLDSYPAAMKEAARLLDQKKASEANAILLAALNTLVVIDRGIPLPVAVAEAAITEAQSLRDKDKNRALAYLGVARTELQRAKELGYAGNDPEYEALNNDVSALEKQLNGNENTTSAFAKLTDKIGGFFKKLTGRQNS